MNTESDYERADALYDRQKERDLRAAEIQAREELFDLDDRVGDLLPSTMGAEPNDERVEELREQLASACLWLATIADEKLERSIRRIAAGRVCGAP